MNKFALLLMSVLWAAAALVSCSDANKLSGATTEPNGIANEESEITNSLSSDNTKLSSRRYPPVPQKRRPPVPRTLVFLVLVQGTYKSIRWLYLFQRR